MRKNGIVLLMLVCFAVLGNVGQNCAWATGSDETGLPLDTAAIQTVRIEPLNGLELQIQNLERQLGNVGKSTPLDEATYMQLKEQLNELYEQRPRERNPLDDGSDTCPGTVFPSAAVPYVDYGTTIGAANNFNSFGACGGNSAPDKIYRYVPASGGYYSIDTFGSDFDTQLYVRTDGGCPGTTPVVCNDDFGGPRSKVTLWMQYGQTYFIIVDGFSNYSGNFVLRVSGDCLIGNQNDWQQECAESVGDPLHAAWDCNGGCNNQWNGGFPQWQQMNLCQFQRGECFTYYDQNNITARDIDTYFFTLTEPCSLSLSMFATFSYNVLINDYGLCLPTNYVTLLNIPQCNGGTYVTPCLPAGSYTFEISPNFYTNMAEPLPYIFKVDPIPCSGCRIDGSFIAPASFLASGCGTGSHNSLRPSDDATYCVVIPYASDWTFSLCNSSTEWNSYLYLTSECSGGIIAQSDNACGSHASIDCVSLLPGNYYITIEGANAGDCAQFYMSVSPCTGSCCYGNDPYNLQCSFGTQSECAALGGEFTLGQPCSPTVCGVRPQCEDGSQFSQLPHLPTESWTAVASDTYINYGLWENYSVPGVISSIRFWGLFTDYNNGMPCINQPCSFQITFVDSSSGPAVQTYFATATGYQVPQNYGVQFPIYQYDVDLPTDCNILNGRVQVKSIDGDACVFAWVSSPQGNGSVVLHTSGGPVDLPMDMAFCLGRGCSKPDSVVIRLAAPNTYDIMFHVAESSWIELLYSDSINASYPATYQTLAAGPLLPGNWFGTDVTGSTNRRYVVRAFCGPPPIAGEQSPEIFQKID